MPKNKKPKIDVSDLNNSQKDDLVENIMPIVTNKQYFKLLFYYSLDSKFFFQEFDENYEEKCFVDKIYGKQILPQLGIGKVFQKREAVGVAHIRPSYVVEQTGERVYEDRSLIFGRKKPYNCIYEACFDFFENQHLLVFEFDAKNGYKRSIELLDFALSVYNGDTLIITGGSKVPVSEMLKFSLEP